MYDSNLHMLRFSLIKSTGIHIYLRYYIVGKYIPRMETYTCTILVHLIDYNSLTSHICYIVILCNWPFFMFDTVINTFQKRLIYKPPIPSLSCLIHQGWCNNRCWCFPKSCVLIRSFSFSVSLSVYSARKTRSNMF